jgi:hypothetical protein
LAAMKSVPKMLHKSYTSYGRWFFHFGCSIRP